MYEAGFYTDFGSEQLWGGADVGKSDCHGAIRMFRLRKSRLYCAYASAQSTPPHAARMHPPTHELRTHAFATTAGLTLIVFVFIILYSYQGTNQTGMTSGRKLTSQTLKSPKDVGVLQVSAHLSRLVMPKEANSRSARPCRQTGTGRTWSLLANRSEPGTVHISRQPLHNIIN